MNTHVDKAQENKSQSVANGMSQMQSGGESAFQFVDNRPEAVAQRKLQEMANNSPQVKQLRAFQEIVDNYSAQQQQPIQKKENKTINNSSNAVIQRTPADWQVSGDITRILSHPHGWFSTWKKIKAKINEYKVMLPAALDARRAKLDEIRPLIEEWEADAKHTAASTEQRVIDIRADMPLLKFYIQREYKEIAIAADAITGGHAETRHGADLTDQQLQDRITTGRDRAGNYAATTTSSRFATHDLLVQTRNDAVNQLNQAKTNTVARFIPLLTNCSSEWKIALNTLPGPARGAAFRNFAAARTGVQNAVQAIPNPSPNMLRVNYQAPVTGGANPGNVDARVADIITIQPRYRIVINKGVNLGPSFHDLGAGIVPAPNPQLTLSVLDTTPNPATLFNLNPAAQWNLVTHYPTTGVATGIS